MFRNRTISVAALLAAAALALLSPGGNAAAQQGRFEETTDVVVVEVPINVLKDGEPVRGLTADDFEIIADRSKLPIVDFEVVDLSRPEEEEEPLAVFGMGASGRRHFLLLFDLSFSDPAAVVKARTAAKQLVLEGLHPSDVVAVGTYSSATGARLLLSFTSDRRQVEYALDTLGLVRPNEMVRDPLGVVLADFESFTGVADDPRGGEANLDPAAEIMEVLGARERDVRRVVQQNEILAMAASLSEMAQMMNSVQGRKHVVFLSEGFDSQILLGTEDQARIQEMNQAAATGQYWEVDSTERFGDTATTSNVMGMLGEFQKADCTIQAVDISGLVAGGDVRPRASGQDGLFLMANETGGELYRNYNNLGDAMEEMLERTSVTYVVAVQPRNLKLDGKYHRLKVKLKGGPSGARLVHRPGFYAPRPYEEQTPLERTLSAASLAMTGKAGGRIDVSLLAAPFEVDSDRAWIPVLVEVDGPSLMRGFSGDVLPAEIYAYALDAGGTVRDFFTRTVGLDMTKAGAALQQSGFKYWADFELPPGDYMARVVVRNSKSGASAVQTQRFTVPAADATEPTLLPPLFPEPPGKWLLAKDENSADQENGYAYPFMLAGQPFIPAARPVLQAGGEAQFCLMGYHLGEGAVQVAGQLLGPDGKPVSEAEVVIDQRTAAGAPNLDQMVARLRTGSLKAGPYTFVVTVTDPESGDVQRSEIPVVVEG